MSQFLGIKSVQGLAIVFPAKAVVTNCSKCKETITISKKFVDEIKACPDGGCEACCQFCIDTSKLSEEDKKYVLSFRPDPNKPKEEGDKFGFTLSIK